MRSHLIHASGDGGINAFGIEDEIYCSLIEITHYIAPCAIPAQFERYVKKSVEQPNFVLASP
jgi:hypothetical protein